MQHNGTSWRKIVALGWQIVWDVNPKRHYLTTWQLHFATFGRVNFIYIATSQWKLPHDAFNEEQVENKLKPNPSFSQQQAQQHWQLSYNR